MAAVTFIAERTAMQIITGVAGSAVVISIMKRGSFVTLLTGDVGVCADQREARDVMVEPELCNPTRRNMTGFALIPNLTKVHIIVGVAAATGGRQSHIEIARMARGAREAVVTCWQHEARLSFVIEAYGIPFENAVAAATVVAETAFVNVVPTMAGITITIAAVAEICCAVTGVAGNAFMTTDQSKPGDHKVIESRIRPGCSTVTIRTLGTVSPFMNVIGLMAGNAGTTNLGKVVLHMAGIAGNAHVSADKRKARAIVIECRVTPVGIAVACRAVVPQLSLMYIVQPMAFNTR